MNETELRKISVWDAPVRVFHWLMVFCFFGAYVTAESERLRLVHNTLGYTMAGLVAFRLLWGFFGTRHARFADFVRGPQAVRSYVGSMRRGAPEHYTGHNPAGALAIVALLGLTALVALTGWGSDNDLGGRVGKVLARLHEPLAHLMLFVVLFHVAGVVVGSLLHRENLVSGMIGGRKLGRPEEAIHAAWRSVALLVLAAVLAFWGLQWQGRPVPESAPSAQGVSQSPSRGHDAGQSGKRKRDHN